MRQFTAGGGRRAALCCVPPSALSSPHAVDDGAVGVLIHEAPQGREATHRQQLHVAGLQTGGGRSDQAQALHGQRFANGCRPVEARPAQLNRPSAQYPPAAPSAPAGSCSARGPRRRPRQRPSGRPGKRRRGAGSARRRPARSCRRCRRWWRTRRRGRRWTAPWRPAVAEGEIVNRGQGGGNVVIPQAGPPTCAAARHVGSQPPPPRAGACLEQQGPHGRQRATPQGAREAGQHGGGSQGARGALGRWGPS